jgi:O-antigen/teichoic acid export membrane protein
MTFFFIAMDLSLIIGCIWLWKNLPEQAKSNCAEYKNREWLLTSFPLMIVLGFHFFNTRCDVLMIGIFIDTKQAGIYTVASRIAEFVSFGLMAISQGAAPMISEFHAQGRKWELQRLLKNSAFTIFIISLSITIVILLFGHIALGLFGKPFLEGYIPLWILVIGQFVNSLNAGGGYLMTMTGYERQASYLIGISTIINISLNFALIPIYGIIGAAIATATGTIIWNVCLFIFVKKNMGINPTIFQFNKKMVCSNS